MAELCLSVHNRAMSNMRQTNKWRRFMQLDGADKWLLLRAMAWLAVARIRLAVVPFRRLSARLSTVPDSAHREPDPEIVRRIGFAVRVAANHVPWRSDCFPQTIAAHTLLRRCGYTSTIHLGVERTGEDDLAAHAWLTCGEFVVTGGEDLDRYTEVHRIPN